ncbi:ribosomal protein S18-alanine N-acetyltransferase [Thalassobaculum sp.]|uniref:ribosomal protein S18-alanine N-acetyltransferase n=1 Tax=Thalassobaculum sp. TaxID=2022740 RepID=UPI003B58D27C
MTGRDGLLEALRAADAADADAVAALQRASFDDQWSMEAVTGLLSGPANLSLVAEAQGRLVGFLIGQCVVDTAEVLAVAVDPGARRAGWGGALLTGFERVARASGAERVILDVAADNAAALALYAGRGYQTVARRDRYYAIGRAHPVDALVMAKNLPI